MRYTTWIIIGIVLLLVGECIVATSLYTPIDQTVETIGKGLVLLGVIIDGWACISLLSPCGRGI